MTLSSIQLSIIAQCFCSQSPVNDASSESSDGSASSESSSESEDEIPETLPPVPEVEAENAPPANEKWNLGRFLRVGIQKSPNENPLSHEPIDSVKLERPDEEEDGEIQGTPSDHYHNENSSSSIADIKSDVSHDTEENTMPPPAKKASHESSEKTPDADLNSVINFIKDLQTIQPVSSISDLDEDVIVGSDKPKKKRPKKRLHPGNHIEVTHSSSDERSKFSDSRRRSSIDEKKPRGRPKNNSFSLNPLEINNTNSDTSSINGTKKSSKSPRKDPQNRKTSASSTSRRRQSLSIKKSRETVPSTDDSSDEEANTVRKLKPVPAKAKDKLVMKKPSKKKSRSPPKISSPIHSSSDSGTEKRKKHSSMYQVALPGRSSSSSAHSDSDVSCRSGAGNKNKKIEKIVSDKNKNDTLRKLFNVTKVATSEGGKGGKGGAKGKGQVVVITPEDAQNQSNKSNDSNASSTGAACMQNLKYMSPLSAFNTAQPSVIVRIDLSRLDLSRLPIPSEKLKHAVIRTKATAIEQLPRKTKKRRRSSNQDDQDRWRHHTNSKNFDHLSVSSSSSSSSSTGPSINEDANARLSFSNNYNSDQLNNNVEHIPKDMNSFYHSPNSVDTKLQKIKREPYTNKTSNVIKVPSNDFKDKIKHEVKHEDSEEDQEVRKRSSSMTTSSESFKNKRKRPDTQNDNSMPLPLTNHERIQSNSHSNGELQSIKLDVTKKNHSSNADLSDQSKEAEAVK